MVLNKKAISPVVATALLLVVAVVAVVGFQAWFTTYQSDVTAQVEQEAQTGVQLTVERLENDTIYLNNGGAEPVEVEEIRLDGSDCMEGDEWDLSGNTLSNTDLDSDCTQDVGQSVSVVVQTDGGIFESTQIVR